MDSSFGKNAANRVEESYGDAKNLRSRHPQAALGFLYCLGASALDTEPAIARWLIDLLAKLGRESDAYDAVGLIIPDIATMSRPGPGDAKPTMRACCGRQRCTHPEMSQHAGVKALHAVRPS